MKKEAKFTKSFVPNNLIIIHLADYYLIRKQAMFLFDLI